MGKSTLMNFLTGENLAIITSKAQTTRQRILGIVNGDGFQIIFSDTPGIIKPAYQLQSIMTGYIKTALSDADILLYVTDVKEKPDKNEDYLKKVRKVSIPVFLLINKIDLADDSVLEKLRETWASYLPDAELFEISALQGTNIRELFDSVLKKLPEHPPYYPKDEMTNKPERFFIAEIIRKHILLNYKKEVPYAVETVVEEYKESGDLIKIRVLLYVERESQKIIMIGNKGAAIKKTGTNARKEMEKFLHKKVFLELFVKVKKNWRNNAGFLKSMGYQ